MADNTVINSEEELVLDIQDLTVHYVMEKETVEAVNHIDIQLKGGEVLGLVGVEVRDVVFDKKQSIRAGNRCFVDEFGEVKQGMVGQKQLCADFLGFAASCLGRV